MKREPEPVPVSVAHSVAHSFRKDVVVIVSYDRLNEMTHTTTWGRTPQDKLTAAEWGDQFAALLCGPNAPRTTFEDFRTVDAAHIKAALDELRTAAGKFLERHGALTGVARTAFDDVADLFRAAARPAT